MTDPSWASDLFSRLRETRETRPCEWLACCPVPGHLDTKPSLSISLKPDAKYGERLLLHCFGCGATQDEILSSLGLTWTATVPPQITSPSSASHKGASRRKARPATNSEGEGGDSIPPESSATLQHPTGCTLQQYADVKRLPLEFLKRLGLSEIRYLGQTAVRIPYRTVGGAEPAVRIRKAISKSENGDERFCWKKGSRLCLYGLDRIEMARRVGYVVLVEGESDCHTCWYHGEPAIGIPGASNFKDERDAAELDGIPIIYVVIEPDTGGEALRKGLALSRIRERVRLMHLSGFKDPSALHLSDPDNFEARWKEALERAVPWKDVEQQEVQTARAAAWAQCQELACQPDILKVFADALSADGVAGSGLDEKGEAPAERKTLQILYLVGTSRLLDRIVSAVVKGPSSAGKSFLVDIVLSFFPSSAFYALSTMSPLSLAYSNEPLQHRILVIYEAAGMQNEMTTYLMRSLLSEGRIRYETVEKTKEGLKPRLIERDGPTGLIVTTTAVSLHPENETRMLTLTVTDTAEQTHQVLMAQARGFSGGERAHVDKAPWLALQQWLQGAEHSVVIPYAERLAERIPGIAVRLRRDFPAILSLICAHTVLHQVTRERDAHGRLVATLADYAGVRELVADLVAQGVTATVPATLRATVDAVAALCSSTGAPATMGAIAAALGLDKSAASRRVRTATTLEYLVNEETERGKPARIRIGDPLPEERELLPSVEAIRECCSVAVQTEEITPSPPPAAAQTDLQVQRQAVRQAWAIAGIVASSELLTSILCRRVVDEQEAFDTADADDLTRLLLYAQHGELPHVGKE